MVSKVAVVNIGKDADKAFRKAVTLIGELSDMNTRENPITIKVGIFNHKEGQSPYDPAGCECYRLAV